MSDITSTVAAPAILASPSHVGAIAVPATTATAPTPRYRTFTFGIGFLCGQASLIFIAILFLRYVVFEDPKKALHEAGQRKKKRLRKLRQRRTSNAPKGAKAGSKFAATTSIPASDQLILSKLSYDLSTHPAESCDWLNVLVAQAVSAYRSMILDEAMNYNRNNGQDPSDDEEADPEDDDKPGGGRGAKRYVEKALNSGRASGEENTGSGIVALDYITVTEFDFGQEYPVCSNARVRPSNESGKVRVEVDIDYSDHVSLAVETKVLINFPRPRFAVIPVNLALALVQFSATLTVEVPPPSFTPISGPDSLSNAKASMSLSLHPDFVLDLASTSLIGSRAKLQDIPKVEQLIIGRIKNYVIENFVWPKVRTFNLPKVGGKKLSPSAENVVPKVDIDGSVPGQASSPYESVTVNGKQVRPLGADDMLRSPSLTSTADDEDEEEEYEEDDHFDQDEDEDPDLAYTSETRPRGRDRSAPEDFARRRTSARSGTPANPGLEAHSSAIETPAHAGIACRRPRRGSSLSVSTTASEIFASSRTTSRSGGVRPAGHARSPPDLSASTSSRSDTGSTFSARDIRQRIPLHSPGLGIGLKPGPSKRHSIQAYFPSSGSLHAGQYSPFPPIASAYSNHLSRTSSVTSLPTLLSPRAEEPSAAKLAALLDLHSNKGEADRKSAKEPTSLGLRHTGSKNSWASPSRTQETLYMNPTTPSKSTPAHDIDS